MDSIVNKLTEIEETASAIVRHAETRKEALDKEYTEKRRAFDEALEAKTETRLNTIRSELEESTSRVLDSQSDSCRELIRSLREEYEEKHTEYAREILKRITEV